MEVGHSKSKNKNPVAEHAIQELGDEILHLNPDSGSVSPVILATATANLNSRHWHDGLSSRELWIQRDQVTGEQLPFDDRVTIINQNQSRLSNHIPSAKSTAPRSKPSSGHTFHIGDLVYIKSDRNKIRAREKYMITGFFW